MVYLVIRKFRIAGVLWSMMNPNNSNTYLPGTIQIPSSIVITAITKAYPAVITVNVNAISEANTYQMGQLVKLQVPITYKMIQADGKVVQILGVSGNNLTVDMNSTNFDPFVVPSGNVEQPAMLSPNGSRNLELNNTTRLVPFQSLNNRGN